MGFVTEPGFRLSNTSQIIFQPFFAAMVASISSVFGFFSIAVLGITLPKIYQYLSQERRQFRYYFFGLAGTSSIINILILTIDLKNAQERCQTTYYSYVYKREVVGCPGIIIVKGLYFFLTFILSLISAGLSSRSSKLLGIQGSGVFKKCEVHIYILCCWSIIYFVSLVIWAIAPTLLMVIVNPNIILPLTVIMLATLFWFSVILTIPQIFLHNLKKMNRQWVDALLYILPFAGLVIFLFIIGIITITYINSVVFGSDIGGPIGLLLATIPSILLTFFSEFYRDWFLTRTTSATDNRLSVVEQVSIAEITTLSSIHCFAVQAGMLAFVKILFLI